MKRVLFITFLLAICGQSFSKTVDEATAMLAGKNFLSAQTSNSDISLSLTYKSMADNNITAKMGNGTVYFYIFSSPHSFVIVSADDRTIPILGFSDEQGFKSDKMSPEVSYMLGTYNKQIDYIISSKVAATDKISSQWSALVNNTYAAQKTVKRVKPLLRSAWDQEPYYNDLCPYDYSYGMRTVTGCVATAMAQVLHYWQYPASGRFSNSYTDNQYGTLTADFAQTNYNWKNMPDTVSDTNSAVATLMYQCGVSVDMGYGTAYTGGSGAWVISSESNISAETALRTYFGYSKSLKGVSRVNYTDADWTAKVEAELDAKRPVIYAGYESSSSGVGGGHCFVFVGYINDGNGNHYFNINWGWSGLDNGNYSINSLNPGVLGVGGGSGNFNADQEAIFGVQPANLTITGIETNEISAGFEVYPNPASAQITLSFNNKESLPKAISILNLQGKVIATETPAQGSFNTTMNLQGFQDGIYFVSVMTDNGVLNKKLVISR